VIISGQAIESILREKRDFKASFEAETCLT
jgi:hypothetical protein